MSVRKEVVRLADYENDWFATAIVNANTTAVSIDGRGCFKDSGKRDLKDPVTGVSVRVFERV